MIIQFTRLSTLALMDLKLLSSNQLKHYELKILNKCYKIARYVVPQGYPLDNILEDSSIKRLGFRLEQVQKERIKRVLQNNKENYLIGENMKEMVSIIHRDFILTIRESYFKHHSSKRLMDFYGKLADYIHNLDNQTLPEKAKICELQCYLHFLERDVVFIDEWKYPEVIRTYRKEIKIIKKYLKKQTPV